MNHADPQPNSAALPDPESPDVWWGYAYNDPQLWTVPCPYVHPSERNEQQEAGDVSAS